MRQGCLRLQPQYPRLAMVCAAMGGHAGGSTRRQLLQKQLQAWPSLPFMPTPVLRLYKLLAGEIPAVAGHTLDWRTAFGLFFWYAAQEEPMAEALREYEYFRRKDGAASPDLQLNLLRLGRTVPWADFAKHVDWMTYTREPLDVALAWHVADLLGGSDRLTLQYAEQLEMLGLWHWATYVLGLGGHQALQEEVVARHVEATAQLSQPKNS